MVERMQGEFGVSVSKSVSDNPFYTQYDFFSAELSEIEKYIHEVLNQYDNKGNNGAGTKRTL
jgi:hypothetical protein